MRIGELARRAQCQTETIRFYEREGLLPAPQRSAGNYRLYGPMHLERLAFVRNCRALDMALDEIKELLRLRDLARNNCAAAHALIDEHVAHVAARIAELQQLKRQLRSLRRECEPAHAAGDCRILDGLGHEPGNRRGRRAAAHVRGTHRSG